MRVQFLRVLIGLTPVMLSAMPVFAADQPKSPFGAMGSMIPMLLFMFVIIWFMMIRPEQKKQKERLKMISNMKKGDRVMLAGGMYGAIHNIKEKTVMIKIADNTVAEFEKTAITMVVPDASADKTDSGEKDKK